MGNGRLIRKSSYSNSSLFFAIMDESFYSPELSEQFELFDAEYAYVSGAQQDRLTASSGDEDAELNTASFIDGTSLAEAAETELNESIRPEDEAEMTLVNNFIAAGCNCSLGPKKSPCSLLFSKETISAIRMNCLEMTSEELDMVILSHLSAHRQCHRGDVQGENETEKQQRIAYYCEGKRVCKTTYLFIHAVGPKQYKNLVKHFKMHGLVARVHGNVKSLPTNTISMKRTNSVVQFISHTATIHALPLPGRLPGQFSDEKALLLPSHMSKRSVYRQYKGACEALDEIPVCRRKFEDIWNELLPHISSMKPATDLCATCQDNVAKVVRSVNLPESEKSQSLKEAEEHLKLAAQERQVYNAQCTECVEEIKSNPHSPKIVHVSFDYAQQIHFPSSPQQVGPLYFLTPRKCQLFGVCSESHMSQVNYLIDENDSPGKGANAVISMVHHYLEFKISACQHLLIHADNAVGQNKNNAVLGYFAWRVMTGLNRTIQLSFMIPGHTKFAPDRFFGQIKKLYRRTSISTFSDIEEVVKSSIVNGRNIPQATVNIHTGERYVTWYNWSEYISRLFRSFPGISKYHHFTLDASEPGTVFAKEFAHSDEIQYKIALSDHVPSGELPTEIIPLGMSAERLQYLFDNIRRYCSTDEAAKLTCPAPNTTQEESCSPKRRKKESKRPCKSPPKCKKTERKCGHCRKTGHTKTVRGKITCPDLLTC